MLVDIKLHLKSKHGDKLPLILVKVDNRIIFNGGLNNSEIFEFHGDMDKGNHSISVELLNKEDSDSIGENDMVVIIDKISFFGISSNRMLCTSKYVPRYSPSYLETLLSSGDEVKYELDSCNYMGWNGIWSIDFDVPIFSWIHGVENLGWVYPS
jgi:hypothetical protein